MTEKTGMSFITTFTKLKSWHDGVEQRLSRCVGYLADKEQAIEAVKANAGDINEAGTYPICVVETLGEGIYPDTISTEWFSWDQEKDCYQEISSCPEDLQDMFGFSLG